MKVNHMRHTDQSYSLTLDREREEWEDCLLTMTEMVAKRNGIAVTFYGLSIEGMIGLATAILAEAYKAKASEKGDQ